VIQPILIRPWKDTGGYEIVAGERRWRCACAAAEGNGGLDSVTIPAIVRELTDDEAADIMMIENLQRDDLTELEEARAFKEWLTRKGEASAVDLAERIGISPRYIRRRVMVLDLPDEVLEAWEKGEVGIGHLEQLSRVKDPAKRKDLWNETIRYELSVERMGWYIERDGYFMEKALFDPAEAGCNTCSNNTAVQEDLFGALSDESKKARCLDPACFKQLQNNALLSTWKAFAKAHKLTSTGFRFFDNIRGKMDGVHSFRGVVPKECRSCEHHLTIMNVDGSINEPKVCMGEKKCFKKMTDKKRKAPPIKGDQQPGEETQPEPPEEPRVAWHGEHFREEFYLKRIPEVALQRNPSETLSQRLQILGILIADGSARDWFVKNQIPKEKMPKDRGTFNGSPWVFEYELWPHVELIEDDDLPEILLQLSVRVIVKRETDHRIRRQVADALGISLAKEWTLHLEYLQKKTIAEILSIMRSTGIDQDPKAQAYLYEVLLKKRGKWESCKKEELIKVILESGVDLAGKVPAEILDFGKDG